MNIKNLSMKKKSILKQIAGLGQLRKGNITFQMVETKNKKGKMVKRGPYPLYSYKKKNKTISKRIRLAQVEEYQKQINEFHKFKRLTTELVEINQQISDILILENDDEKKT